MDIRYLVISLLYSQIFCELNETKRKIDSKLEKKENIIPSLIFYFIFIASCIVSFTIIFKKYTLEQYNPVKIQSDDKPKSSESETNTETHDTNEKESNIPNCIYGLSLFGRFLMTIFSLDVLFFLYNLVVQAILLFPGLLYDMTHKGWRNTFYFLYGIFTIFSASILIIPTYEFFSFSFLRFENPFIHLISFRYILNDDEFDKYKNKKNKLINYLLSFLGFFFLLFYIIGFNYTFSAKIKDIIEIIILTIIFIYYISIILCYAFLSFYFF